MSTISTTTSRCPDCNELHPARYEDRNGNVFFVVDCPKGEVAELMSTDAALFSRYRQKANFDIKADIPFAGYGHVNLFEITNLCNYRCLFCYTGANADKHGIEHKSVAEILDIARLVKAQKGYGLTLTGGEPTLHPQVIEVIRQVKALGLSVTMPSNGHTLGRDASLAANLKAAGLGGVGIQFDSFNKETQRRHRGNDFIEEKLKAVENCKAAGLRFMILPTISRLNIGSELGDVIRFALRQAPCMYAITSQLLYQDKNNPGMEELLVTREDVVKDIVATGAVDGLSVDHFWPIPQFLPVKIGIHPDCGLVLMMLVDNGRAIPLDMVMDMPKFHRLLGSCTIKTDNIGIGMLLFLGYLLRAVNAGQRLRVLKALMNTMRGKGGESVVLLSVESFHSSAYQDENRARRCASFTHIKDGINQRGCHANRIIK